MEPVICHQTALVYVMVIAAFADSKVKHSELMTIIENAKSLPIFNNYPGDKLEHAVDDCIQMLDEEGGIDAILSLVKDALPKKLNETAYALACDVIAVDGKAAQEELRWLEILASELGIDSLHAAGIERGSKARYARMAPSDTVLVTN